MKTMTMIRSIAILGVALACAGSISAAPSKADVGGLLQVYFSVERALAADDLAGAQAAATSLAEEAGAVGGATALASAATVVAKAADIRAARAEFQPLSSHLQTLVESTGGGSGPVYVVRCPMAFNGKGGTWLQDNKTVANPYYGAAMLRCGGVIKEMGGGGSNSGHQHNNN